MSGRGRRFSIAPTPLAALTEDEILDQPTALVRAFQAGEQFGLPPAPTLREAEIIKLFANDLTVEEIAKALTISRYTVRSHVENMRLKYKKRSMAGIVALVLRQGWIP